MIFAPGHGGDKCGRVTVCFEGRQRLQEGLGVLAHWTKVDATCEESSAARRSAVDTEARSCIPVARFMDPSAAVFFFLVEREKGNFAWRLIRSQINVSWLNCLA
jgi:hypothetical protein